MKVTDMNIRGRGARLLLILLVSYGLACCGTKVPDIAEIWDRDIVAPTGEKFPAAAQIEYEIKKRVLCDLREAVRYVNRVPVYSSETASGPRTVESLLPLSWGAQVSLSLQVVGESALNPGATLTTPMPNAVKNFSRGRMISISQSFGLNLGANLSSTATRIDKFEPYWPVAFLMTDSPDSVCRPGNDPFENMGHRTAKSSLLIKSDLGILDWLYGAMIVNQVFSADNEGITAKHKKEEVVTYQIDFVIVTNGEVTPVWKLLRVSANSRSPLFKTGRTRTHSLIITLGPQKGGVPTQAASNAHLASQIGNSVGNANRALISSSREFGF